MLGTKRTKGRVWWHSLDPKKLKYMRYLSHEKCKWTFEVTYYPNQSIHWPSSDWKYDPGIHWVASCYFCCFCIASVVSDSVRPHRQQPTRIPGILQVRILEWVAISFSNAWKWKVKVKSLSRVWLSVTPWTAAHQAPPSMGFSRQEYWSGVPLPSPWVHWWSIKGIFHFYLDV